MWPRVAALDETPSGVSSPSGGDLSLKREALGQAINVLRSEHRPHRAPRSSAARPLPDRALGVLEPPPERGDRDALAGGGEAVGLLLRERRERPVLRLGLDTEEPRSGLAPRSEAGLEGASAVGLVPADAVAILRLADAASLVSGHGLLARSTEGASPLNRLCWRPAGANWLSGAHQADYDAPGSDLWNRR